MPCWPASIRHSRWRNSSYGTYAKIRNGPAEQPSIFFGSAMIVAPVGGDLLMPALLFPNIDSIIRRRCTVRQLHGLLEIESDTIIIEFPNCGHQLNPAAKR